MNISIQQLEAFLEVSRQKSFSHAAKTLCLSQPALSTSINKLEATLGIQLLTRSTRVIRLTQAGKRFLPHVELMLNGLKNAVSELQEMAAGSSGSLVISCLPSVAAYILPQIIMAFNRRYPKISIHVKDELANGVIKSVGSGESDLGISILPNRDHQLHFVPLISDRYYVTCRKDHPLAGKKEVSWSELKQHHFLSMNRNTSVRQQLDETFIRQGREFIPFQEVSFLATIGAMVKSGLGVTLLPSLTFPLLGYPDFAKILFVDPIIERMIGVLTRDEKSLSLIASNFVHIMKEVLLDEDLFSRGERAEEKGTGIFS